LFIRHLLLPGISQQPSLGGVCDRLGIILDSGSESELSECGRSSSFTLSSAALRQVHSLNQVRDTVCGSVDDFYRAEAIQRNAQRFRCWKQLKRRGIRIEAYACGR
jgi:hypothetical protein